MKTLITLLALASVSAQAAPPANPGYSHPSRLNERPARTYRKTPPCPTAPGSTICLPHGFGAPRSR